MIYACVILVAGSCPVPGGCCEDTGRRKREKDRRRRTRGKKKGRVNARVAGEYRGAKRRTETRKTETKWR